jgi:disks large protein 1
MIYFHVVLIAKIKMCSDEDWWQARRVLSSGEEGEMGLVPSRTRWEKKVRARHR